MKRVFSILFTLALVLAFSLVATAPAAAQPIIPVPAGVGGIFAAVAAAPPGAIIQLVTPGGIYIEPQITILVPLTIMGLPGPKPIIQPAVPLQADGWGSAWFLISPSVTFVIQDVILDGTPAFVRQAIRNHGMTTIQNVDFLNIRGSLSGTPYKGIGIQSYGGLVPGGGGSDSHGPIMQPMPASQLSVLGCTFQGMGRIGVLVKGNASTATVSGCTYTGRGNGDWLDYGVEVGAGGQATITGNTMTNCGNSTTAWASAGILVTDAYGPGSAATITGNTLTGNQYGIASAYNALDASVVIAHFNNISGNVEGIHTPSTVVTTDGECNWWGDASGPTHSGNPSGIGDATTDFVDYIPWLTEPYAPQRSVAAPGGTAYFTPTQGSIEGLTAVPPPATPPVTLPYGMFNFTVCCFSGSTATLNILLPGPVPVGTKWYKYNGGAWDALPIGDDNGDAFITVTLTDGDPIEDEDSIPGQITDQGGPGYPGAVGWDTYQVSKARVLLPWLALLAAIILAASLLALRHRQTTT